MKQLKNTIKALLLALSGAAALSAQEVKFPPAGAPSQEKAPEPAQPQFTEAQLLETLGWYIGKQQGLVELGFSKEQVDQMVKGFYTAAAGKEAPYNIESIGPEIGKFMQ